MIFVRKPTVDDDEWKKRVADLSMDKEWDDVIRLAKVNRTSLIEKYNKDGELKINSDLYKRYMDFLRKLFNGKCAYCEARISTNQPGDVEHFRPKGSVVDDNFKPIRIKHPDKGEMDHPGYYWLAYEWNNLFPSCSDCNRYRKHGAIVGPIIDKADAGAGKADRFPVKDEARRAILPDQERAELALLINPSDCDPNDHLEFCSNGIIKPKTPEGEKTLKVFGLNGREDLPEARAEAFGAAKNAFKEYFNSIGRSADDEKRAAKEINRMMAGDRAYSAMQRLAIAEMLCIYRRSKVTVTLPLDE